VAGCGEVETIQHLFISCPIFAAVWGHIRSWLGIASVEPFRVIEHFYKFVYPAGGLRTRRACLQLIWLCCVSIVWNERNSRVFRNTESTIHQLVEKGGWNRLIFLSGQIFICGGRTLLFVWALANLCFIFFFGPVTVYFWAFSNTPCAWEISCVSNIFHFCLLKKSKILNH